MRQVGTRKEAGLQTTPSASSLVLGAQFNLSIAQLSGGSTFIPKGLYRFRTHEEAAQQSAEWLAAGMAQLARERGHG